jgi:hypothetical protein
MVRFLTGIIRREIGAIKRKRRQRVHGKEQATKHLWELCPKCELGHLRNEESRPIKILRDRPPRRIPNSSNEIKG